MVRKAGVEYTSHPQRNYCYGASRPESGEGLFWDQVRLKHRYRNKLVELELERREFYYAQTAAHSSLIENLAAWVSAAGEYLDGLRAAIQAEKGRGRTVKPDPELGLQAKQAREDLAELRCRLKCAREAMADDVPLQKALADHAECAESRKRRAEKVAYQGAKHGAICANCQACRLKIARAESGLFHGCYLEVETAAQQFGRGCPPEFRRYPGEGYVSVQVQGGISVADLLSGRHPGVKLEPAGASRGGRRRFGRLTLRLGGKGEIVAPVVIHREMPADGIIKWAHLHARKVGVRIVWQLRLAVASPSGFPAEGRATGGDIGINVGWRLLSNGNLRVACAVGDDGRVHELVIPEGGKHAPGWSRWDHRDSLRQTHDGHFNTMRDNLLAWLKRDGCPAPDWLRERFSHLHMWRSAARLADTLTGWWQDGQRQPGWAERGFPGDESIFAELQEWAHRRHVHYLNWACAEDLKCQRWRDDLFRNWVANLRKKYRTAHIAEISYSKLTRLPVPESDEVAIERARYLQRVASPGRLTQVIAEGFPEVVRHEPAFITLSCHACGGVDRFDASRHLCHRCPDCGAEWDQDANAARNLLASGQVLNGAAAPG